MKTKPILIIAVSVIILAIGGYFLFKKKSMSSPRQSDITQFLKNFNRQVAKGNRDSLFSYFAGNQKGEPLNRLLTALINKTKNPEVSFKLELNVDQSTITFTDQMLATAVVPVTFSDDHLSSKLSSLTFTIQKNEYNRYKIYQVDGTSFMTDYMAYKSSAWQKNYSDKEIYSPATLKAFADASNLKTRYDSVVWFSHIKDQTYFYVVKGKWNFFEQIEQPKDTSTTYKMGLAGPDYKEIIPADYDLVHTIGGTFPNLIEVEKDHKRGFYDLTGKIVIPVEYDQVFPLNDSENIAAMRKGDDYFWLKSDYTISEKADIRVSDIFSKLKQPPSFTLNQSPAGGITEFNSKEQHGAIYIPPSYLVDLKLIEEVKEFKNPLRNHVYFEESSSQYIVKAKALPVNATAASSDNWIQSAYYSIRDYFIGGRISFYDSNNMVLIDNKNNKLYGYNIRTNINTEEGGGEFSGRCNEFSINPISDSLLEVKATSVANIELYNNTYLNELPVFHLLKIQNGKVEESMNTKRIFAFTKFLKMDNHFIEGCYVCYKRNDANWTYTMTSSGAISPEVLRYMKNEIYADYNYKFKDKRWTDIFTQQFYSRYKPVNASVQDSLTEIDKYNIQWIDQKLKSLPAIKPNVLAAK
ncbi:WG repeat-containing protein [Mucilaginibacter angelicae]|uniref:WG repeat-containing protein n=1 Tax=Mucilaginibacter angelicae TaxID=869718 RepID=A0ABV6LB65_9SPHI